MKKNTFKGRDNKELKDILQDKSNKLQEFKQAVIVGRTKNVKEGREIRKDIARILTELNTSKV